MNEPTTLMSSEVLRDSRSPSTSTTTTTITALAACPTSSTPAAASSSSVQPSHDTPPPPLELGWTRLKRRRIHDTTTTAEEGAGVAQGSAELTMIVETMNSTSNENDAENNDTDDDDGWLFSWCCDDPSCRQRSSSSRSRSSRHNRSSTTVVRGRVVWFLPESTDSTWFQGYLFPSSNNDTSSFSLKSSTNKAWGLLAQTVEIDECLTCAAGGFRRLDVTAYQPKKDTTQSVPRRMNNSNNKSRNHALGQADWTGGDMMRLRGQHVWMQPQQILTHEKAVPYVRGIFASLWKRLVDEAEQELSTSSSAGTIRRLGVLDVLPDVAIVLGDVEISLPQDDKSKSLNADEF